MSRPELQRPPELFYDEEMSRKYHSNSRMVGIQSDISERCIELLNIPLLLLCQHRSRSLGCFLSSDPRMVFLWDATKFRFGATGWEAGKSCFILDVGCGSGLSGQALEEAGHVWLGLDISGDMLDVANERETDFGDLCRQDMGTGLPFRPSTFDGCISVSALQWLCYAQTTEQVAKRRLLRFFSSLYGILKRGSRAALQFYPDSTEQAVLISSCAAKAGFAGGLVVDYPNSTKAKKYYLCLSFDQGYKTPAPRLGDGSDGATEKLDAGNRETRGSRGKAKRKKTVFKSREWVMAKKGRQRRQGKDVRVDSKFTGRKRKDKF